MTSSLYKALLISFILTLAASPSGRSQAGKDTCLSTILTHAYSALKQSPGEAERLFEVAVSMYPSDVNLRRQLGFIYNSEKKYGLSLMQFAASEMLRHSDTTKLQIAYILLSMDRRDEAGQILGELRSSLLPDIRASASSQLSAGQVPESESLWWTRFYLAPYYDTRWSTSFFYANLEQGLYLNDERLFGGYGFLLASGDSRSEGGLSPAIFSDNALIAGLGVRLKPFRGFQINIQEGAALDLITSDSKSKVLGDFRSVAVYSNGVYAPFSLHSDPRAPLYPWADLYSSAGYYSRYKNSIAHLQGRAGLRFLEVSNTVLDLYVKGDLILDAEKEFYNNLTEGALGIRLTPHVQWGLYLAGEINRGSYLDRSGTENPYDTYYNGVRLFLIFDRTF